MSAAYSATFTQNAGGVIEPDRSPVAPIDELDNADPAAAAAAAGAPKRKPIRTYIDGWSLDTKNNRTESETMMQRLA